MSILREEIRTLREQLRHERYVNAEKQRVIAFLEKRAFQDRAEIMRLREGFTVLVNRAKRMGVW